MTNEPNYVCAATDRGVIIADNPSGKMYLFSTSPGGYLVQEIVKETKQ
jgi:hypothetical protein